MGIEAVSSAFSNPIWQAGTSKAFDSNHINEASVGDFITLKSHDKLKTLFLNYQSVYGNQTWQDGNLPWWTLCHKVMRPFDYMVLKDHVTTKIVYFSATTVSMATKPGRIIAYLNELLPIKSQNLLITWSCKVMWQTKNHYISTTTVLIATKFDRMITYFNGLLPTKSHNILITWSLEITWQNKTTIFPLPKCLWLPSLAGW